MNRQRSSLDALVATKTQADLHDLLPQELKPCVAVMLEEGPPGGECDPNTTCYIIATEFRRLGKPEEEALEELREWAMATANRGRALPPREVETTVDNAYRGELHSYGCKGRLYRSGYCMGREECPYYGACGGAAEPDEEDFYHFGWPERIGSTATALYAGIRALEYIRQVPGGRTFASYRQLHRLSGCSVSKMKDQLTKLQDAGLIDFTPGQQGSANREATEIRRTVPIPEPPFNW